MPTDIEWTHFPGTIGETWNPINATRLDNGKRGWHCEKVSPGCANCYAETFNGRNLPACGTGLDYTVPNRALVQIGIHEDTLSKPLHWAKPRTIFVCSMTDLFADFVPYEMIRKVLGLVGICKKHRFIILTKRSERMREVVTRFYAEWRENDQFRETAGRWAARDYSYRPCIETPFANLILGVSVENQRYADERIPELLETPAACRFLSVEPLLGPITFRWAAWDSLGPHPRRIKQLPAVERNGKLIAGCTDHLDGLRMLDWVVVGGESGPGARPMHPDWVRDLKDQCVRAGVPYFLKQMGGVRNKQASLLSLPEDLRIREFPHA